MREYSFLQKECEQLYLIAMAVARISGETPFERRYFAIFLFRAAKNNVFIDCSVEAITTYSVLESKIRTVPEEYLAVIDAFIDGLMIQYQMKKNSDYPLVSNWVGYRECHIQGDRLLIYKYKDEELILSLTATGTHSDLF